MELSNPLPKTDETRTEHLRINIALSKTKLDKYIDLIKTIAPDSNVEMANADVFKVHYAFGASYLDGVEKRLSAINQLLDDKELIVDANIEELNYGESLIIKVLDNIRSIKGKLNV